MSKTFSILLLIFFINIFEIKAQTDKPAVSGELQIKTNLLLEKAKKQESTTWILLGSVGCTKGIIILRE